MCKQYTLYHRKTRLNEGITESYRTERLFLLETLSCKKRLKTCAFSPTKWRMGGNMHAVHGSMRERKELLKVTLAEGWINSLWELGVCSSPVLEQPCNGNAKTWLIFRCNLIKLEGSYLVGLMDTDDLLYPHVQNMEEFIRACKTTWASQNDFE